MDPAASSAASGLGRRTNPSRSKRGGPGVGTCDVDLMILESYKRKLETEPLIPEDTSFILTTNASKYSGNSSSNGESTININTVANDRYFDRPEVLRAFREQEIIQTPEFWPISESSSVGGRFRPRGAEDESAETSDAAYEKRHKKFETFEKRQRHREKEKLKHEHYKLKERIEQLRATDSAAFMAVPAATFWALPPQEQVRIDVEDADGVNQVHLTAEQIEGERRKKEMLDHAISLEKRYSYLLPSDRARKTQDSSLLDKIQYEDESETEKVPQAGPSRKETESIKFRIPARSSLSTTPASSPAATKPPKKSKGNLKQPLSSRSVHNSVSTSVPPPEHASSVSSPIIDVVMDTPEAERSPSPPPPPIALPPPTPVPDIPASSVRVTSVKLSASSRQTNGKKRAQKDDYELQPQTTEIEVPTTKGASRKNAGARPIDVQIADDGESEKAPSDEEVDQSEDLQVPEKVSKRKGKVQAEPEPVSDAQMLAPDEVSPEVRETATRLQQMEHTSESPAQPHDPPPENVTPDQLSSTDPAPVIPPDVEEGSISTRPMKRQRKLSVKARAQSLAQSTIQSNAQQTPSVPPKSPQAISQVISTRLHRKHGPRGQSSMIYTSSTTGQEVRTTSFLMMAAIRSEGAKRNVEKRHNTSFGIATPTFKVEYEFEIPEWFHYPEDEEPVIPLPDDYAFTVPEPQPLLQPATPDHENDTSNAHADEPEPDGKAYSHVSEDAKSERQVEEEEAEVPVRQTSPELESEQQVHAENADKLEDEIMETEPTEPEHVTPPTEPESEPGVNYRVLSHPRDEEEEEELEW